MYLERRSSASVEKLDTLGDVFEGSVPVAFVKDGTAFILKDHKGNRQLQDFQALLGQPSLAPFGKVLELPYEEPDKNTTTLFKGSWSKKPFSESEHGFHVLFSSGGVTLDYLYQYPRKNVGSGRNSKEWGLGLFKVMIDHKYSPFDDAHGRPDYQAHLSPTELIFEDGSFVWLFPALGNDPLGWKYDTGVGWDGDTGVGWDGDTGVGWDYDTGGCRNITDYDGVYRSEDCIYVRQPFYMASTCATSCVMHYPEENGILDGDYVFRRISELTFQGHYITTLVQNGKTYHLQDNFTDAERQDFLSTIYVPLEGAREKEVTTCSALLEAKRKVVLSGRWHLYYGIFKEPNLEFIFDDPSPRNVLRFTTHVTEDSHYAINDFHVFLDKKYRKFVKSHESNGALCFSNADLYKIQDYGSGLNKEFSFRLYLRGFSSGEAKEILDTLEDVFGGSVPVAFVKDGTAFILKDHKGNRQVQDFQALLGQPSLAPFGKVLELPYEEPDKNKTTLFKGSWSKKLSPTSEDSFHVLFSSHGVTLDYWYQYPEDNPETGRDSEEWGLGSFKVKIDHKYSPFDDAHGHPDYQARLSPTELIFEDGSFVWLFPALGTDPLGWYYDMGRCSNITDYDGVSRFENCIYVRQPFYAASTCARDCIMNYSEKNGILDPYYVLDCINDLTAQGHYITTLVQNGKTYRLQDSFTDAERKDFFSRIAVPPPIPHRKRGG